MKIKKGFVKRKIGDNYLVVSTKRASAQSMFIELNETSSYIWDLILKGYDVDKIAESLSKNYSVSFEKAKSDTEKLIENMKSAGIFEEE